jgi:uncharacterized protein
MDIDAMQVINKITTLLALKLKPKRIILFGSYANGNAGKDSDVDLMLVMANGTHRRSTTVKAYQSLGSQGIAKDIVVVTEDDVEKYGSLPGTIIGPAISHGKVVYDRAA